MDELIPLSDRAGWDQALGEIPHSFHHTWEHSAALHEASKLPTYLFSASDGDDALACPIVERSIGSLTDIATPSGLAGFIARGDGARFLERWRQVAAHRGWVSAYVGLHPLFEPRALSASAHRHNALYGLDLSAGSEALLRRMDQNRRRQLRGWENRRRGFVLDRDLIADFLAANYESFMTRRALRAPYAGRRTLIALTHSQHCLAVGAASGGQLEAASIFGATSYAADLLINVATDAGRRHATDLLWFGVMAMIDQSIPAMNLGGGSREGDGVSLSKQRYRPDRLPLGSIREVFDAEAYGRLCAHASVSPEPDSAFFPAYRSPEARAL